MRLILQLFVFLFVFIPCTWLFGLAGFAGGVLLIKPEKPTAHSDAIIVLTGGKDRIETGLDLFAEGLAPELFITGVHDDVTQAEITARYTGAKPLPECCMVLGYEANSTTENAAETKEWVAGKKYQDHPASDIKLSHAARGSGIPRRAAGRQNYHSSDFATGYRAAG
jgi:uncharacterized SAM-binding protein YcdF (DUF218 family)